VKVKLRNPDREVELPGGRPIREVLAELDVDPDTVLVIRGGELVTRHENVANDDELEIRPVISGGAA
jgi:sulfur carrier protein ThiS